MHTTTEKQQAESCSCAPVVLPVSIACFQKVDQLASCPVLVLGLLTAVGQTSYGGYRAEPSCSKATSPLQMLFSFGSSLTGEKCDPGLGLRLYTDPREKPTCSASAGLTGMNSIASQHPSEPAAVMGHPQSTPPTYSLGESGVPFSRVQHTEPIIKGKKGICNSL